MALNEEWAEIVNVTTRKYLKDKQDLTMRKRLFLAMLDSRGGISYNHSGDALEWPVESIQPPVEAYADGGRINYAPREKFKRLKVDWRGYTATDAMTEKQKLMNKGAEALVNRYAELVPGLDKAMRATFATELYINGYGTGNQDRLHGLESFMAKDPGYTEVVADRVVPPLQAYGEQSTKLRSIGGTWSSDLLAAARPITNDSTNYATDWPDGAGSSEYDYLSPKLINWASSGWNTSSATWEANGERSLRMAISWVTALAGEEGKPDLCLMTTPMFADFKNKMSGKMVVNVPHAEAQDLGFSDVLNFDGVAVTSEFGCPSNTAYVINLNQMELRSLASELFVNKGPDYDPETLSYLFLIYYFGNMTFQPKYFAKLYPYKAS
jgi:hypothetical protein